MLKTVSLLGVNVSRVDPKIAQDQVCQWVKSRFITYVCVAPVSTLVDAQKDPAYRTVLNNAGMVTPDGMPVVWLAKSKGCAEVERTYGPDLMKSLCARPGLRHYFLGGTPEVLDKLAKQLKISFPGIDIAGTVSTPFRPLPLVEDRAVIQAVNDAKADILWVGLGSPKQDFWMKMHRELLDVPVIIGVGAAFDFLAGVKPQAPRWIGQIGFEWLFRLCCEPKRLWKRYLLGNSLFVYYVIKDMFKPKTKT